MPVNWNDKAVQDRLVSAIIAAANDKINMREIARMFGGGLSYDALEGHLRKFRPEARKMIAAAKDAEPAPKSAGPRKKSSAAKSTTSPSGQGVISGRVTKKKAPAPKVKKEIVAELELEV